MLKIHWTFRRTSVHKLTALIMKICLDILHNLLYWNDNRGFDRTTQSIAHAMKWKPVLLKFLSCANWRFTTSAKVFPMWKITHIYAHTLLGLHFVQKCTGRRRRRRSGKVMKARHGGGERSLTGCLWWFRKVNELAISRHQRILWRVSKGCNSIKSGPSRHSEWNIEIS